jgi:hypothetical protein
MMDKDPQLVVLDIDLPGFSENRALDSAEMARYPGAEFMPVLGDRLAASGIDMVTADVFLADSQLRRRRGVCVSNEQTRYTRTLLRHHRLRGSACFSGESPIVAWRFYRRLGLISRSYDHLFLFSGARGLATGPAKFHDFDWPCPSLARVTGRPWAERRLVTLINSNKRVFGWPSPLFDSRRPRAAAGRLLRAATNEAARAIYPWMKSELYVDRLAAIAHFGGSPDFDLFGRGWSEPVIGASGPLSEAISQSYRGELGQNEKLETLANYRFSLCFENSAFPGYITEKIFDCFLSGTIPVYLGAPDVADTIPPDAFVDLREFADFTELEEYMYRMKAGHACAMLEAAESFLESEAVHRFHMNCLVAKMYGAIDSSLHRVRLG